MELLGRLRKALELLREDEDLCARIHEFQSEFDKCNFEDGRGAPGIFGDPWRDIGTAMRLAEHYNIELSAGLSHGSCLAYIEKSHWQCPLNHTVPTAQYGGWFRDEDPGNVTRIVAFGQTLNEAVCKCLIYARRAGVI